MSDMPVQFRFADKIEPRSLSRGIGAMVAFQDVLRAERGAISDLVRKLDAVLDDFSERPTVLSDRTRGLVVPSVSPGTFEFLRVGSAKIGPASVDRRLQWLHEPLQRGDLPNIHVVVDLLTGSLLRSEFHDKYVDYWVSKFENASSMATKYLRLHEFYYRYVIGGTATPLVRESGGEWVAHVRFGDAVAAVHLLRGHPLLDGHIEAEIHNLRNLLGVTNPVIRNQELAGFVLLAAFLDVSGQKRPLF